MWVTKLLISPVKKRIFCPKTTKFGPKLAFLVNLGQAMQAYSMPCWWVGWWLWRAGCISQDTYLLYYSYEYLETKDSFYQIVHFQKNILKMYQVLHPEQNRLLSVREYARSQGFRCVELMINMEKVKRSYNFAQPEPISYIFYHLNYFQRRL